MMRATGNMSYYMLSGNMARLQESYHATMEKIATQKKINRPSDDPLGMMKVIDYNDVRKSVEQYKTNISLATSWLAVASVTLQNIDETLGKIKSIAMDYSSSNDYTRDTFTAAVKDLTDQVYAFANNKFLGQYLFSGSRTETEPFDETVQPAYQGDDLTREVKIGPNTTMAYTIPGSRIFLPTGPNSVDLFKVLDDLQAAMAANNDAAVAATIEDLSIGRKQVQEGLALVGIKDARFKVAENHLTLLDKTMADLVDRTLSSNVEELAMLLAMQKISLDATYSLAARMQQTTILNFLR